MLLNAEPSLSAFLSCFKSYLLTICMELLFSNLLIKLLRREIRKVGVLGSSWSFPGGIGGRGQATRSSLHSLGGFLRNSYSFRKLPATNLVIESADLVGGSSQSACGKKITQGSAARSCSNLYRSAHECTHVLWETPSPSECDLLKDG